MPNQTQQTCPLLLAALMSKSGGILSDAPANPLTQCMGPRCQFWTTVYTTELISVGDCAIALGPQMNSDGQLVV